MIIHILADGRRVDDIRGHMVPITDRTRQAYSTLSQNKRQEVMPRDNPVPTPKDSSAAID